MRISDWSSDVCSSDLHPPPAAFGASAVTAAPDIGVLLVNLGTPDAPEPGAVRRYLAQFLSDRRVVEIPPLVWQPILRGIVLSTRPRNSARSEEHTSELQSLMRISYAVFCLKNNTHTIDKQQC